MRQVEVLGGWLLAICLGVTTVSGQVPKAASGDWPWWRGPNFNGVAESGQRAPVEWSETKNVAWKTAVPGRGHSTPIVVGGRVFLQTADETLLTQSVLCFDRKTGKLLWNRELNRGNLTKKVNPKNTHATSTIASDRGRLFVLFCNNDAVQVTVLDLDGKTIWKKTASPFLEKKYSNGYAASPVLWGDTVIIACDCETGSAVMALDRDNGKTIWSTQRPAMSNYASPIVGRVAARDQVLIGGLKMVAGYDP
ncbi:MAG: PQQ-binding-like beta-propeller repeat protein, partial [Planctomycetaceae bacterium]